jgi:hypothetical protein
MSELIEKTGILISITAAGLLVLSTAYDFSFLIALNLSFNEVPTTISDHIRSAIIWLPKASIYILILVLYEMAMRWVEDGLTEEEIIQKTSNPKFFSAFRSSPKYIFIPLIILIVLTQLLLTNSLQFLYLFAIVFWGYIAIRVVHHKRLGEKLTSPMKRAIVAIPMVIIWVASLGYTSGERIINKSAPEWNVIIERQGSTINLELLGVRRFSNSAIIVDTEKKVSVIPNSSIITSELVYIPNINDTRICRWLGIGCSSKPVNG